MAAQAKKNLPGYANVAIEAGDGAAFDPGECDAIFVNCGVTHLPMTWLERLREGGRLVVPFTTAVNATIGQGVMMKIVRLNGKYATEPVSPVGIYSGGSLRDADLEPQLLKGLTDGKVFEGEIREAGCASCGKNVRGTRAGSLLESSGSEVSGQETHKE